MHTDTHAIDQSCVMTRSIVIVRCSRITNRYYFHNVILHVLIGLIFISFITSSLLTLIVSASASSSTSDASFHKLPLEGIKPDPFVVAAPIIVAAVCKDGVAIIAAHPPSLLSIVGNDDAIEVDDGTAIQMDPLLYYRPSLSLSPIQSSNQQQSDNKKSDGNDSSLDAKNNNNNKSEESNNNNMIIDVLTEEDDGMIPFVDIPNDFGGPYRITSIGRISTDGIVIMSCGWRPDCQTVFDHCETLLDNEIQIHGRRISLLTTKYTNDYLFPNRLASQLSYYMAQCAVSERVRTLSCVTFVISAASRYGEAKGGCIWLVDPSGSYPVRAHCIGGAIVPPEILPLNNDERKLKFSLSTTTTTSDETKLSNTVSDYVNRRLLKEYFTSTATTKYGLEDCTVEEGLKRLVLLLANKDIIDDDEANEDKNNDHDDTKRMMHPPTIPLLRRNTQLELAILKLQQQQTQQPILIRKTLKELFGNRLSR